MPDKQIVDIPTYTTRPRGAAEFLRLYEELVLAITVKHWKPPDGMIVAQEESHCASGKVQGSRLNPTPTGQTTLTGCMMVGVVRVGAVRDALVFRATEDLRVIRIQSAVHPDGADFAIPHFVEGR